jgi:hypothetical protein
MTRRNQMYMMDHIGYMMYAMRDMTELFLPATDLCRTAYVLLLPSKYSKYPPEEFLRSTKDK